MRRRPHAKPGQWLVQCDRTGFTRYSGDTQVEWNGLRVWNRVFEERNAQDFVKGIPDDQSVPDARPLGVTTFIGPLVTEINATHAAGDTSITIGDATRMSGADILGIILDNGDTFRTTIQNVDDGETITISPALPSATSAGKRVTNYTAVASATIE